MTTSNNNLFFGYSVYVRNPFFPFTRSIAYFITQTTPFSIVDLQQNGE